MDFDITTLITRDKPFGPVDAKECENPDAFKFLFSQHNKIYKELHQRPSIVARDTGTSMKICVS